MPEVTVYTDGACSGNPGKGGWGAVLICDKAVKEISGSEELTTNNKMELTAVIMALKELKTRCKVNIYTDSKYVYTGITEWIYGWMKSNWRNSQKQAVKNKELWLALFELSQQHDIKWNWVKGHAGHEMNERADLLATTACQEQK